MGGSSQSLLLTLSACMQQKTQFMRPGFCESYALLAAAPHSCQPEQSHALSIAAGLTLPSCTLRTYMTTSNFLSLRAMAYGHSSGLPP